MDLEQTFSAFLSKYKQLEQENDHLKRERARMQSLISEPFDELPAGPTSGATLSFMQQNTCNEGKFRKDLQQTKVRKEHRTSSPINFKSFVQNSIHTDQSEMPEFQNSWEDISIDADDANRLLGEIAFQLDKRILSYIFQNRMRHYGFTLLNIPEKIIEASSHPLTGKVDDDYQRCLSQRHAELMGKLSLLGYKSALHPPFTELVVNTFGVLRERPNERSSQTMHFNNPEFLKKVIATTAPVKLQKDLLLVLACLCHMAQEDGRPLLLW